MEKALINVLIDLLIGWPEETEEPLDGLGKLPDNLRMPLFLPEAGALGRRGADVRREVSVFVACQVDNVV